MISVLNEISKLRNGEPINIDYNNSNRYRVITEEKNRTKTAYYFSTPIYNNKSGKVVDFKLHKGNGKIYSIGSNSNITYSDKIQMENDYGFCTVYLDATKELLYPTTNGFMLMLKNDVPKFFDIEVGTPFMQVRANNKYFSLMSGQFRPFVTVSCIGTADENKKIIAPAKISYQKISDCKYRLNITPCDLIGEWLMLEINLYENKLFQDTTVESYDTKTNNAFGTTAYIGNTSEFGEQWLYSKLDYSIIAEMTYSKINKTILHLPKYNGDLQLSAFKVSTRFCSFASNWENKISMAEPISDSLFNNEYDSIDITSLLVEPQTQKIIKNDGLILKPTIKNNQFSVISTADSCYSPQILEINYN